MLDIHAQHNALISESFRALGNDFRMFHRSRIDAYFFSTGKQHFPHVFDRANAAAHRKRNKNGFCHPAHHVNHNAALFMGGGNIVKYDFISTGFIIYPRHVHRIADVHIAFESDAFGGLAFSYVQTGNNAFA